MIRPVARYYRLMIAGAVLSACADARAQFSTPTATLPAQPATPLNVSTEAEDALAQLKAAVDGRRWVEAAELYERIMVRFGLSRGPFRGMISVSPLCYQGAATLAFEAVRDWPDEGRAAFDELLEPRARQAAQELGDRAGLTDLIAVAERWPFTAAGQEAARKAAAMLYQEGRIRAGQALCTVLGVHPAALPVALSQPVAGAPGPESEKAVAVWPGVAPQPATSPDTLPTQVEPPAGVCTLWQREVNLTDAGPSTDEAEPPARSLIISAIVTTWTVFLQTDTGILALDADTGHQKWLWEAKSLANQETGGRWQLVSRPLLVDGGLYIGIAELVPFSPVRIGVIRLDCQTGQVSWRIELFEINDAVTAPPASPGWPAEVIPGGADDQVTLRTRWGVTADLQTTTGHIVQLCLPPSYVAPAGLPRSSTTWLPARGCLDIGWGRWLELDTERVHCRALPEKALLPLQSRLAADTSNCLLFFALLRMQTECGISPTYFSQLVNAFLQCTGRMRDNTETWSLWMNWLCDGDHYERLCSVTPALASTAPGVDVPGVATPGLSSAMAVLLDQAAQWPGQRAQWRLRIARHLADKGDFSGAANLLQEILETDVLRTAPLQSKDGYHGIGPKDSPTRPLFDSGDAAKRLLGELLDRQPDLDLSGAHGRARRLYDESLAAQDAEGLRQVVERYPFAPVAGESAQSWAELTLSSGRPLRAAIILERAYRDFTTLQNDLTVLAIDAAYQAAGESVLGVHWLKKGMIPISAAERGPSLPQARVSLHPPLAQVNVLTEDAAATLLTPDQAYGDVPQGAAAALLFQKQRIDAIHLDTGEAAWSFPWRWTQQPLWSARLGERWLLASRDSVTCLNGSDGEIAWSRRTGADTEDLLNVTTSAQPLPMQALWPSLLIRVHDKHDAVALATLDGRVTWQRRLIHSCQGNLTVDPWHFAYTTQTQGHYRIAFGDAATGDDLALAAWEDESRPVWMGFLPTGALLAVNGHEAVAINPQSGDTLWAQARPIHAAAGVLVGAQAIYLPRSDGSVEALGLDDGTSLWRSDALPGSPIRRMLAGGDSICAANDRMAVVLRASDGRTERRSVLPDDQRMETIALTALHLLMLGSSPIETFEGSNVRRLKLTIEERRRPPQSDPPAPSTFDLGEVRDLRAAQLAETALLVRDGSGVRIWR